MNLAQGVMQLIHSDNFGVYHLTDRTEGGLNNPIEPITSEEFKPPAKRPAYSVLDTTLFTETSGYEPMPWQESLKRFIDTI
jgi:dTDP-4-dehydrorhamnose reductase